MANVIQPQGLVPIQTLGSSTWNGAVNLYFIPSTDGNAFSIGDPVASVHSADAFGVPAVTIGAAGAPIRGAIVSIAPVMAGTNLNTNLDPANTIPATKTQGYYVYVADDPNTIFTIQENGGTALTGASMNLNINFTVAEPAQVWQVSQTVLNNASAATTATLNLRLLRLDPNPLNGFGVNATWRVLINSHELRAGATATP